jgi:protein-S-isoprenylcysteine O-methyltransferase Ste14
VKIFLPCFLLAYVWFGGVRAVMSVRRKYGVDPLAVSRPDPIMVLGETYRNLLMAAAIVLAAVNALRPSLLALAAPVVWLEHPLVQLTGGALMVASLILVRAAQIQMKGAWRFGCDRGRPPAALVTGGLYARSRNPIYVGMTLTSYGFFLALPNAVSFTIANLTLLLLQVRVRVEEEHLMQSHPEAFAAYRRATPRWLFRTGADDSTRDQDGSSAAGTRTGRAPGSIQSETTHPGAGSPSIWSGP